MRSEVCSLWLGLGLTGVLLGMPTSSSAQTTSVLKQLFGAPVATSRELEFNRPLSYGLYQDGSIAVVDFNSPQITRISREGRVVWQVGRAGSGPGEFRVPYRVVVLPDQSALIFDLGNARATRLDSTGKYVEDLYTDMVVDMANIVSLPSGEIAISGITRDPRGSGAAVHVFSARLRHLRSFGPLPDVSDPRLMKSVGAGGLTLGRDNAILHTRYYPFEIRRFNLMGKELGMMSVPLKVDPPEKFAQVTEVNGRVSTRFNRNAIRASPVHELANGQLLTARLFSERDSIHLLSSRGILLSSIESPRSWSSFAVIDGLHRTIWIYGENDDAPVLWRVPMLLGK